MRLSWIPLIIVAIAAGCSSESVHIEADSSTSDATTEQITPDTDLVDAESDLEDPVPDSGSDSSDDTTMPADGDNQVLQIEGTLKGTAPAAGSKVLVLWTVSAGSPDYTFKVGELAVTGSTFSGTLEAPPAGALNMGSYGVGNFILVPADYSLADGKLSSADFNKLEDDLIGGAESHAVIYHAEMIGLSWHARFEVGLACGVVAPPLPPKSFVTFEPTDCNGLEVTVSKDPDWPNWT